MTGMNRRALALGLGAWAGLGRIAEAAAATLDASERLLPTSADLRSSLAAALARKEPLILLATLQGCPFCKVARENYLVPEMRDGRAVTQIHFLSRDTVRDWQGHPTTHGQLVKQLHIESAPTVLFYGPNAQEVAPRLVGGATSDFYSAYLDERVALAREAVRAHRSGSP